MPPTWQILIVIGGTASIILIGRQAWLHRQGRKFSKRFDIFCTGFGYGLALAIFIDIAIQEIF